MRTDDHFYRQAKKSTMIFILCSIVLVLALVLGTGAIQLSLFNNEEPPELSEWTQARFLAKSGSDAFVHWLVENPEQLSNIEMDQRLAAMLSANGGESQPEALQEVPEGHFVVKLSQSQDVLIVRCEGSYRNATEMVETKLVKSPSSGWQPVEEGL